MIKLLEIPAPEARSKICDTILRALPDWFGIESSIVEYVAESAHMPFFSAYDGTDAVGFAALKEHNAHTAEVYVMGVREGLHGQGIGRALLDRCRQHCIARGMRYLTVKTLDESHPDPGYTKTRKFYLAMGFVPLEVFPTLWDPRNPCLFMAMHFS